jgi:pre-mRNA-splicing factor SYF1
MLLDLRVNRLLVGKQDEYFMRNVNPEFPPNHREWQSINAHFEQSLVLCNKFPKIWYLYCQFLMHQPSRITFTRRTFDRALKALPVTQHKSLWDLYLAFANRAGGDTTIRIWRRFLKIQPTHGILDSCS